MSVSELMRQFHLAFAGHNPGGRYISLMGGKYTITLSDRCDDADAERLAAWISTVPWPEVDAYYGFNPQPKKGKK